MDRSNFSYCDDCLVPVTAKHIILECPNFQEQRVEHFGGGAVDMCDILWDGNVGYGGDLYKYLDSIHFLSKV